ncbi:unnamed protein product, partial [Didymodactylos carnosus]
LDNNDLPICTDANSNVYTCVSSSIESFRRLYPQHQLIYNSLQLVYAPQNNQLDLSYRYSDCFVPQSIISMPGTCATVTVTSTASPAVTGTYDLHFNGNTYSQISADISTLDLANRLQSSPDFGFLNITRGGDCGGYSYSIEWMANGGDKPAITIANQALSSGTVGASTVQNGGVIYQPLSGDITRIYHTVPQ